MPIYNDYGGPGGGSDPFAVQQIPNGAAGQIAQALQQWQPGQHMLQAVHDYRKQKLLETKLTDLVPEDRQALLGIDPDKGETVHDRMMAHEALGPAADIMYSPTVEKAFGGEVPASFQPFKKMPMAIAAPIVKEQAQLNAGHVSNQPIYIGPNGEVSSTPQDGYTPSTIGQLGAMHREKEIAIKEKQANAAIQRIGLLKGKIKNDAQGKQVLAARDILTAYATTAKQAGDYGVSTEQRNAAKLKLAGMEPAYKNAMTVLSSVTSSAPAAPAAPVSPALFNGVEDLPESQ